LYEAGTGKNVRASSVSSFMKKIGFLVERMPRKLRLKLNAFSEWIIRLLSQQ
jgi:hypothetical protein